MTSNSFHKFAMIAAILCLTVVTSKPIQMFDQIPHRITVSSSSEWPNTEADNEKMTLHCELTPDTDEDVRYSWFKDDTQIGNGEYLVVEPFTRRDLDEYVCQAQIFSRTMGNVRLNAFKTFSDSQEQEPRRTERTDIINTNEIRKRDRETRRVQVSLKSNPSKIEFGKRAELEAVLSEPTDNVEIFWYKDGQFVQTGDILVIDRFEESDRGVYKCEAKIKGEDGPWASMDYSGVSERNTKVRRNQELNRVKVSLKSNPSWVEFGKRAVLEAVLSEPTDDVEIFWYKDGQFVQTGDILVIERFEESDRGVYKCEAKIRGEDGPWASMDYSGVIERNTKVRRNQDLNRVQVSLKSNPSWVEFGKRAVLEAVLSEPTDDVEIFWYKDGQFVQTGDILVIERFEESDRGVYKCEAKIRGEDGPWASMDYSGVSERNTKVRRNQELNRVQVSLKSNPSWVEFGKRTVLEAVLSEPTDDVEIFWYKDGQFVQTGDILVIERFEESDRGVYKCEAKIRGEDGPWASMDYSGVIERNTKVRRNQDLNRVQVSLKSNPSWVEFGKRTVLEAVLSEPTDDVEIFWYKDGQFVQTGDILVIERFEESDRGVYKCEAKIRGEDGPWASMDYSGVIERNTKVRRNQDLNRVQVSLKSNPSWVEFGKRTVLEAVLSEPTDDVEIFWYKDGQFVQTGDILVIERFEESDRGVYKCEAKIRGEDGPWASVDYSGVIERNTKVRRNQDLNRVQVSLKSNPSWVEFGKRAVLEAVLSEPTDDVEIFWYKDGQFVQTGDILVIERFEESDRGVYKCEAKIRGEDGPWASMDYSGVSERNTKVRRNQDLNRVQVSLKSNPSKVKFGKRAELEAILSEPTDDVEIFWYKDGQFVQTGDILVIERFEESDRGVYKCEAKIRGEDGPWASMDYSGVSERNTKVRRNQDLNRVQVSLKSNPSKVKFGKRAELEAVLSEPTDDVEIFWYKDGQFIQTGDILVIERFEESDRGVYKCEAKIRGEDGPWASMDYSGVDNNAARYNSISEERRSQSNKRINRSAVNVHIESTPSRLTRPGQRLELQCLLSRDLDEDEESQFRWTKDGEWLADGSLLVVPRYEASDAGRYDCFVTLRSTDGSTRQVSAWASFSWWK